MNQPLGSFRRTLLRMSVSLGCGMLLLGCPHAIVIPDEKQPHQVATGTTVEVWCHGPDGASWTRCKVRAEAGWWLVSDRIVNP
jgi:hypothetical protein